MASFSSKIPVPSHAVGHIIGQEGAHIKYLTSIPNTIKVKILRSANPNTHTVNIETSTQEALDEVQRCIDEKLKHADLMLERQSRQKHSNRITPGRPDSHIWDAREIHHRPTPPIPKCVKPHSKADRRRKIRIDKEKKRQQLVREKERQFLAE